MSALIDGIPALRTFFSAFDFDSTWRDFIANEMTSLNETMQAMFDEASKILSFDSLSPAADVDKYIRNIIAPSVFTTTIAYQTQFPTLAFDCTGTANSIPIVSTSRIA